MHKKHEICYSVEPGLGFSRFLKRLSIFLDTYSYVTENNAIYVKPSGLMQCPSMSLATGYFSDAILNLSTNQVVASMLPLRTDKTDRVFVVEHIWDERAIS